MLYGNTIKWINEKNHINATNSRNAAFFVEGNLFFTFLIIAATQMNLLIYTGRNVSIK